MLCPLMRCETAMPDPTIPPVPEIGIAELRADLRGWLRRAGGLGQPLLITRRGRPVAGLVSVPEATVLWRIAHEREIVTEWKAIQRLDEERRLRIELMREVQAENRARSEARFGR